MEMCRVCLSSDKEMLPLDETFINNYNLLTNLNITLLDGLPQCCCQSCSETIKYFVEFRENSIASETTLRTIIESDVKQEKRTLVEEINKESNCDYGNIVKNIKKELEIKQENDDSVCEEVRIDFEPFDGDISQLVSSNDDIKTKKRKKSKRKKLKEKDGSSILLENLVEEIEQKWFCGLCPKSFDDKDDLDIHLKIHKKDRRCKLCKEDANSYSQLLAHRLMHVPIRQYKCHICSKRFKSCIYLEHHYRNVHIKTDDPVLTCKYCARKCKTPKKLAAHRREVHAQDRFFCDICAKGYPNKNNLKSHICSHSEKKKYVCDLCGFSCKRSGGLRDHTIRKHVLEKVYCKNCNRPFVDQETHDKHACTEKKCIVCPVCGESLNGNARLNRHMKKHSDVCQYECTRCPAKFKTKGALIVHNNRHDGNRTHQCQYCPAKFYSASVLTKHRRTHTGEKPYVCHICTRGFTGGHNLKVHMKVHGEYLVAKKYTEPEITITTN